MYTVYMKQKTSRLKNAAHRADITIRGYNFLGLVTAVIFFCLSLYPSLLPRTWVFQGLVSAFALAIGYGLGTALSFSIRWLFEREIIPTQHKPIAWRMLYIIGGLCMLTFIIIGGFWQNELRQILEVKTEKLYVVRVFVLAILLGLLLIKLGRQISKLNSRVYAWMDKFIPRRISAVLSIALVAIFIAWVVSDAFIGFLGMTSGYLYDRKNRSTPPGITQPVSSMRSGSAESLIPWDTLGYQGQKFVATGPSQPQLEEFTEHPTKEQIRIYAGVNSGSTPEDRTNLALKELERTGAFDREVLVIATPTGTGWLNPQSMDALEYMYGGDTAIVAQQYSYLPSWISFLVDKQKAEDAGKTLYDAVYHKWSGLPKESRPKLIMYGLSLGSFGGQSAFNSPSSMIHSVDGALWQGTPGDTELWKAVTARRDPGSPQWQPIVDDGRNIRFASKNDDLINQNTLWEGSRVLYMQHGSDPIVWFNFDLPFHKPDWYSEKRAPDVLSNTIWVPLLSFLQLASDQVVGMGVPKDYGHNYESTVARAWSVVTNAPDWNEQKTTKLQTIIDSY